MDKLLRRAASTVLGGDRYAALREGFYRYKAVMSEMDDHERALLTDPRWVESVERLRRLRDRHAGKRGFIIGNGPSLKTMDLRPLRDEITFGLNRITLMFDRLGFETTYHVVVNPLVISQCAEEIGGLRMPHFVNWRMRDSVEFTPSTMFLESRRSGALSFSFEPADRIWEGATVTYVAMQLAYHVGLTEVVLIGVDHSFATRGAPHSVVVSQGPDQDHFDPGYFGKGFKWQLPDLATSEAAYRLARHCFEQDKRRIVDATVDGKLQVFPKVDFKSLF